MGQQHNRTNDTTDNINDEVAATASGRKNDAEYIFMQPNLTSAVCSVLVSPFNQSLAFLFSGCEESESILMTILPK